MTNEKEEKKEEVKRRPSGWGTSKDHRLIVDVDIANIYEALGVLRDAEQYLVDLLVTRRMQIKAEEEKRRQMIQGNDPLVNGAKNNKDFFNKHLK